MKAMIILMLAILAINVSYAAVDGYGQMSAGDHPELCIANSDSSRFHIPKITEGTSEGPSVEESVNTGILK